MAGPPLRFLQRWGIYAACVSILIFALHPTLGKGKAMSTDLAVPTFAVLAKVGTSAACVGSFGLVTLFELSSLKKCYQPRPRRPHLYEERKGGPAT